jgi:hypothetical protein
MDGVSINFCCVMKPLHKVVIYNNDSLFFMTLWIGQHSGMGSYFWDNTPWLGQLGVSLHVSLVFRMNSQSFFTGPQHARRVEAAMFVLLRLELT